MAALHITAENFESEVLKSDVPVLVDFWADWCMPCKMLAPVLEELANEVTNAKICKINIDEAPELTAQYRVMSVPTLVVFKNGEVALRNSGVISKEEILDMLNV